MKQQLISQGVNKELLDLISNSPAPKDEIFIGADLWEKCITALISGSNIILSGNKSTGKNVLARDLAYLFGVENMEVSFHGDFEANTLISNVGILTRATEVPVFGVLDEINMAQSDALAILHSALDFRRTVDFSSVGGDRKPLHRDSRFIGTMNYGYMGTKELNEALVSRFQVILMPKLTKERLIEVFALKFALQDDFANRLASFFLRLQERARVAEISTKAVDLRGLLDSLRSVEIGLDLYSALEMGVIYKAFNEWEEDVIYRDMIYFFPINLRKDKILK